mmetsp:Transcript_17955/g.56227  ORF Transcript_17955/g.56227 Transcript_17955/m.56227 type:complete len:194 (-) Transcript_17955:390-971(-)
MFLTLSLAASAFTAPVAHRAATRSSVRMGIEEFYGADVETGGIFDPAGFTKGDVTPEQLVKYRTAELKHGRLAMLAVAGFVAVDLGVLAPGAPSGYSSVAAHDMAVEKGAMYVLLFAASVIEVCAGVPAVEQMMKGSDRKPGDFSFDPLNFSKDAKSAETMALKEIQNGRLAMLAFSGMVTQSVLYDKGFPYF